MKPEDADEFLKAWEADATYFKSQPGLISAQLHKGIGVIGFYYYHKRKTAVNDAFARGNIDLRDLAPYNNDQLTPKFGLCKTTSGTVTRNCDPRKTITLTPAQKAADLG